MSKKPIPRCRVGTLVQIKPEHHRHFIIVQHGTLWIARERKGTPPNMWRLQSLATGEMLSTKRENFIVATEDEEQADEGS